MANPEPLSTYPGTEYVLRFEGEGVVVPPQGSELPIPNQYTRPKDGQAVYSSLVHAAIKGQLTPEMAEEGVAPEPTVLSRHTRLSAARISRVLTDLSPRTLQNAVNRAGEIDVPPFLPWSPELQAKRDKVVADRLAEAQAPAGDEGHISWKDVQERYHDTFFRGYLPHMEPEGRLGEKQRIQLQEKLVELPGLPRIAVVTALEDLLADLSPRTPSLCIASDSEVIALRSGQGEIKTTQLHKEHTLLLNLYLIRGLAGAAGVSRAQMIERTGYSGSKFDKQFTGLLQLFDGSGVMIRTRSGKLNPHHGLAAGTMVVDARPLPEAS